MNYGCYATTDAPEGPAPHTRHRPRRPGLVRSLIVSAAVPAASCQQTGILDPQGPIASAQRLLLINSTEIMLVVIVPVILATLGFAWWYRSSNTSAKRSEELVYEGRIDFVVWSIPALVVILLGGVNWISSHELDPRAPIAAKAKPLEVDVVSLDWKWLFIYPDQHVASVDRLVIPAGIPIRFSLTSGSVMTAFFVPQLGSMIYTMNGMVTHLNLRADQAGDLQGLSAHFSGDGFPDMLFDVHVVSPLDFPKWVEATAKSDSVLNADAYKKLSQQSIETGRPTYRLDDPRLFNDIATLRIPPGPGPQLTDNVAKSKSESGAANVR